MALRSVFQKLVSKKPQISSENPKIVAAIKDFKKKGYSAIGVYKTGSEELFDAVEKAKSSGHSVFGTKIGGSTILLMKKKTSLAKDLLGATKVAAKGLGDWADRVAPDEKPTTKRKAKVKAKAPAQKKKRAVKRVRRS